MGYEYDSRGNVDKIRSYNYTSGDLSGTTERSEESFNFSYTNAAWVDGISQLSEDSNPLTYDENGNLINIEDCCFNWTNGRQLESVTTTDGDPVTSYTYDENEIRTSKTYYDEDVNEVTLYYTTINGNVISQYELDTDGSKVNEMIFIYNSDGELVAFNYQGTTYLYVKNHLGDVVGITDDEGNWLVKYYYDSWGNTFNTEVNEDNSLYSLAERNPMRYRSYYYDADFQIYYLQSRYYISTWSRFLNADIPNIAQESKDEQCGLNLFAYCCNDPVNNEDPTGYRKN